MKVIIAGGRDLDDARLVLKGIKDSNFTITEVVSGGAKGIDRLGEKWSLF
jgi:hydroxymethylpyrimidine pyrophosphatase-like HAD family hydrolase